MTTFKRLITASAGKMTLAQMAEAFAGGRLPLWFSAYDGSSAGPADAPMGLDLVTPRGTTYLATAPNQLGLVRAYVSHDLELHGVHPGDPYPLLAALAYQLDFKRPSARVLANVVRSIGVEHLKPIAPPPQEALPDGAVSSRDCGTAKPATRRRSSTTTTCPTPSTNGCLDRQ